MRQFFYLFFFSPFHREFRVTDLDNIRDGYNFKPNDIDESNELNKIIKNFKNKDLINRLRSDNLSTEDKLDLIEKYDIFNKKYVNLFEGGLMDDFNFDFDYIPPA